MQPIWAENAPAVFNRISFPHVRKHIALSHILPPPRFHPPSHRLRVHHPKRYHQTVLFQMIGLRPRHVIPPPSGKRGGVPRGCVGLKHSFVPHEASRWAVDRCVLKCSVGLIAVLLIWPWSTCNISYGLNPGRIRAGTFIIDQLQANQLSLSPADDLHALLAYLRELL